MTEKVINVERGYIAIFTIMKVVIQFELVQSNKTFDGKFFPFLVILFLKK